MPDGLIWQEQVIVIVFQQELPVRLVNISRSGCLLQASRHVRVGTVGRLRIALDEAECADDVRVARCTALPGAGCELGIELLWVSKPKELSSGALSLALRLRVSDDGPMPAEPRLTGS
jgi:hypothetical protein